MICFIATVWRRQDVTPEEFDRHWRVDHAALVNKHAAILGIKKYVQSPRLPDDLVDAMVATRGWTAPPDGLAQVYWESVESMRAAMSTEAAQKANAELSDDEAQFCDVSRMSAFLAHERTILE